MVPGSTPGRLIPQIVKKPFVIIVLILMFAMAPALWTASASTTISQSGNRLISSTHPRLGLVIDQAFAPMPALAIRLDFTNVDRRIFVRANHSKNVLGLIVVQFETVRPGATFKFVYHPRPPAVFGSDTYRFGAYVY